MIEWQEVKLKDVCLLVTDGAHSSPPSVNNGYPMASVKDMTDFPALIRSKLDSEKPSRDLLVESYANYLKPYFKATSNYWKRGNIYRL